MILKVYDCINLTYCQYKDESTAMIYKLNTKEDLFVGTRMELESNKEIMEMEVEQYHLESEHFMLIVK